MSSEDSRLARAYLDLKAKLADAREALDVIASWGEGPVVKSSFDSPGDAQTARDCLGRLGSDFTD